MKNYLIQFNTLNINLIQWCFKKYYNAFWAWWWLRVTRSIPSSASLSHLHAVQLVKFVNDVCLFVLFHLFTLKKNIFLTNVFDSLGNVFSALRTRINHYILCFFTILPLLLLCAPSQPKQVWLKSNINRWSPSLCPRSAPSDINYIKGRKTDQRFQNDGEIGLLFLRVSFLSLISCYRSSVILSGDHISHFTKI